MLFANNNQNDQISIIYNDDDIVYESLDSNDNEIFRKEAQLSPPPPVGKKINFIDNFFKISENKSTIKQEIYAGFVNFLTMSYILVANPTVLSISGIPIRDAGSGTCMATFFATLIAGLFTNLPIGCAPGVGLSAYFSYSIIAEIKSDTNITDDYNLGLLLAFFASSLVLL